MIWVIEHGDNIGTLKNCFLEIEKAQKFAEMIVYSSECRYKRVSNYQWICLDKDEIIEIQID